MTGIICDVSPYKGYAYILPQIHSLGIPLISAITWDIFKGKVPLNYF